MSVGDVTHHLAGKVRLFHEGERWVPPDWTYHPGFPGPYEAQLPRVEPRPLPAVPAATKAATSAAPVFVACDCGKKLDALLAVLGLPEGLRGLVLALAAEPGADALDVLADHLEERMDPRSGRFRKLAGRARKAGRP